MPENEANMIPFPGSTPIREQPEVAHVAIGIDGSENDNDCSAIQSNFQRIATAFDSLNEELPDEEEGDQSVCTIVTSEFDIRSANRIF